jgi:hypothetical protein
VGSGKESCQQGRAGVDGLQAQRDPQVRTRGLDGRAAFLFGLLGADVQAAFSAAIAPRPGQVKIAIDMT